MTDLELVFDFDHRPQKIRDLERLVPVARWLAARHPEGITVADLRAEALARGLLTGEEQGRRLSFLGAVMRAAGLRASAVFRRSPVKRSHGNLHRVWVQ